MTKREGFSLVEIIVAVAVLAVIAALTANAFSSFYKNMALNSAVEQAISVLQEARSNTLSGKDSSQWGVHFEISRLAFFKGTSFTEPNPNNRDYQLSYSVEIYGISLNGGGPNVIFQKLTGKTNEYGAVSFRLKSDVSKTKTITIESNGSANY